MDGRDAFLTLARDKHFEFSSLRRAQFSTLCMLYELHNQGQDKFVYTCNNCKNHVETRYHCTVCDVSVFFILFTVICNNFLCCLSRTLICVSDAKKKSDILIAWRDLVSIWTMAHHLATARQRLTHKRHGNNLFRGVFSRLCMRVNVGTRIVAYLRVKR